MIPGWLCSRRACSLSLLVVIGLMWAFLASFYFSGSTVIYFLLRRDVDGTDLEEVHTDDEPSADSGATVSPPEPSLGASADVALPVSNAPPSGPPAGSS